MKKVVVHERMLYETAKHCPITWTVAPACNQLGPARSLPSGKLEQFHHDLRISPFVFVRHSEGISKQKVYMNLTKARG